MLFSSSARIDRPVCQHVRMYAKPFSAQQRVSFGILLPHISSFLGKMSTSLCRQNLHDECEVALSQQINLELDSGYTFFALASQFARDDIALPGAARFFRMAFHEENEHAEKLMDYLLLRGEKCLG
ncbi:unnamed protein product [Protopolystoma xenopodis]|uniref:Ferritin n=1 Tax=Protopolystoma xenopodis TaxID=117903 RepID=A0A3S5BNV4_9PLAT|nr:unnamed protein product [Protopolystoma xenopodis]